MIPHHSLLEHTKNIIPPDQLTYLHILHLIQHNRHLHFVFESCHDFSSDVLNLLELHQPLRDHQRSYYHRYLLVELFSFSSFSFFTSLTFSFFSYYHRFRSLHHHRIIKNRHQRQNFTFSRYFNYLIHLHQNHYLHYHLGLPYFFSFSFQPLILMFSFLIPLKDNFYNNLVKIRYLNIEWLRKSPPKLNFEFF